MVPDLEARHPRSDLHDNARALVAENGRKRPFGIPARQREIIGVAQARRLDLDQHLAGLGPVEIHLHHFHRLARFEGHGGCGTHQSVLPVFRGDCAGKRRGFQYPFVFGRGAV